MSKTIAQQIAVSIHAPVGGRDGLTWFAPVIPILFQSTRPWEGATRAAVAAERARVFQSTRPWEGATALVQVALDNLGVSIHAPVGGRDDGIGDGEQPVGVSIHAPVGGRDRCRARMWS